MNESLTMKISIIIPVYNEAVTIGPLIHHLIEFGQESIADIIVVDGGSTDNTYEIATALGVTTLRSVRPGRALQMNDGAAIARGQVLYFVHADTLPPTTFVHDISKSIRNGFEFGRFRSKFDSHKLLLKLNAFFTRFDLFMCYGGDQSLFMTKKLFGSIQGFDASMLIMEDYAIVQKAKQEASYKIIPGYVLISARKYETNSWWKVQKANYRIVNMFKQGSSQEDMIRIYRNMLSYRKIDKPRYLISRK